MYEVMDWRRPRYVRLAIAAAAIGVAASSSALAGTPAQDQLPDLALGWPVLLHIERACALLLITGAAMLVVSRALNGELPVRFAHVEYESATTAELANHEQRLRRLEAIVAVRPKGLENGDEPA
jgi:hypothetical protein